MSRCRLIAMVALSGCLWHPALFAGKLESLRDRIQPTRSSSARRPGNDSKAAIPTPEAERSKAAREPVERPPSTRGEEIRTRAASSRKLAAIQSASRRSSAAVNRPSESIPDFRRHRSSSFGRLHFNAPICAPSVIHEHHYLPVNTVMVPVVVEHPASYPAAAAPPPIMPVESAVVPPAFPTEHEASMVHPDPANWLDPLQIRFEIDYAADEDDVQRMGFGLLVNATAGLGIDTGMRLFREQDADFRDHLWLGDINVVYELFPSETIRTRAGVGFNWLADSWGAEGGLNLTLGTELFWGSLVLSAEADLGTLGDADLFHGRATVAFRPQPHVEWFAGYDHLDIGGVAIRGAVAGLRFRF